MFVFPYVSYGASAQVYKGKVLDSKTREPLMYVNVSREDVTNEGTMTDDKGEFNTRFSDNKITFSYVGCQQITKELTTDYTEILMDCGEVRLDEVVVDFKKICESEPNNGTYNEKDKKCDCPEGRKWNDVRNECMVSEIATLPVRKTTDNLPDKLEARPTGPSDKDMCESPENAGQWNEKKNTCKCPKGKTWIPGDKKCEDADLEAMRQACWKLMQKGKTLWDEETNSCTCIKDDETVDESKRYEYDAKRKSGKCVEIKKESKPEPVKQTTKPKERTEEEKAAALSEKQTAYEDAKANEQSTANRRLTALTTAATGIGGMELAQGIAEKSADKNAQMNMDAYIATMRCTYGNGKSVKASLSEVELPGGNDATIMQYRNEYMTLASDLKQRKESLGMKPGIESEVIYDKSTMGLYDEENVGISGGNYASLYRAKMLGSEEDQTKITEEQSKAANRLKYGAIAAGAGVAVGIVGNSVINGKIGEKIKEIKNNINYRRKEESVLKDLKQCLKDAGATNVDKLKFNKFTPSLLNLDNIDCKKDLTNIRGNDATTLFSDSDDGETITNKLVNSFGEENAKSMLGDVITNRGDFGVGQKYCGLSVEGALVPVRTSATPWNRCDELKKGEWRVEFAGEQYLEGVSVCSATGVSADVDDNGVFSDDVVPEESLQTKIQQDYDSWVAEGRQDVSYLQLPRRMGCYCKTDQIGAKWVFNYVGSPSGCKTNCAWDCGSRQTGTKIDGKVDFTKTLVTGVHTIYRE